ncbi:MAG: FMN-binding protein [Candidatus Cloacimonetes bacterium]|nr:FMN-binding protein [Candidatus Cloacimonadota bacterium]
MREGKKLFRESMLYPVFFMLIITIFFISILATLHLTTQDRIKEYKRIKLRTTILEIFALPLDDLDRYYEEHIREKKSGDIIYYVAFADTVVLGYCFPVMGNGLWGTISALLAVTPDFSTIVGFDILAQNETPGLGGRITESWFKNQFSGKKIIEDSTVLEFNLVAEGEITNNIQVNQITGATQSSKAVVKIITSEMKRIVGQFGKNYD